MSWDQAREQLFALQRVDAIPAQAARARPDAPALIFGDRVTTFAELDRRASQVAQGLLALGVTPGEAVAVVATDSDAQLELIFGIARARAVFLGVNYRLTEAEVRFILEDSGARLVFCAGAFLETVQRATAAIEREFQLRCFEEGNTGLESYRAFRDAQPAEDPALGGDRDDVFAQLYTSGTTGTPKGVRLAHRSFFAVVDGMRRAGDAWIGWRPEDVSLHCLPAFHIGGLWWVMTTLAAGAALVVMESWAAWQALRLIEEEGVTKAAMVPAMIQMVLLEPECGDADFSSLECMVYGGSPITSTLLERARETFGCAFAQLYGLTETGNTAVCLRPEDHDPARPHLLKAAGRPYPGVRVKVIDAAGAELPAGEIGEVCLHSPANMVDYWNRPEATAETLRAGWIHTGDGGYLDPEGYLFICDRIKDMIIYAGENVYPAEVEDVLAKHPAIKEVGVIGVPDERWGERVHAVVVVHEGQSLTLPQLSEHARRELADHKLPRSLSLLDALPRTPSGKIKKAQLRAPYWKDRERQVN